MKWYQRWFHALTAIAIYCSSIAITIYLALWFVEWLMAPVRYAP